MYDVILKNGFVINGSGNPGIFTDVAVQDGKIAIVGKLPQGAEARETLDVRGLTVCPGLVDPHLHEELPLLDGTSMETYIREGIATVVNGNCGHSITPGKHDSILRYMYENGLQNETGYKKLIHALTPWSDFSGYCKALNAKKPPLNSSLLLGYGTIRWTVMGGSKDRRPTAEEERQIFEVIEEGMKQGAAGISTGLAYIPCRYADYEELRKVCEIVAKYDGVYASHIRYEIGHLNAVRECIDLGRDTGVRVQISHLTPTSLESYRAIAEARKEGIEIAVDTIPKSSGHCMKKDRFIRFVCATVSEMFNMTDDEFRKAAQTPEGRKLTLSSVLFNDPNIRLIRTSVPEYENQSIDDLAKKEGRDPAEMLLDIICNDTIDCLIWTGGLNRNDFSGKPYDPEVWGNPVIMAGSDRIFGDADDPYSWYELFRPGSMPNFINNMTGCGVSLEEVIRHVTSLPAQQFRLSGRGLLLPGYAADIFVMNREEYRFPDNQEVDYNNPLAMAKGVYHVLINGTFALKNKKYLSSGSGMTLGPNGRIL
ncbi:putative D-aminoacylase [Treponema primitia ZAS-2]|uniref:Putative D-aminoacylase n=1 Tax=Treponema primitia (strain ATCC BAA-887 / DSM 12427 / ZAS-2) TaxID=545694 RepID=F5YM08_TREPZ|nr:amidohydrolase family protein [Treponema primitia]AEF85560.1 putative D-aminoacylase [Treponema primitia ZAS-2]